jgi:hypothetical protein
MTEMWGFDFTRFEPRGVMRLFIERYATGEQE